MTPCVCPADLSFADGSLIEPTACAVKALRRARLRAGDSVCVIGLGIMGQLNVALARHAGAGTVMGTDFVAYRRDKALELGADAAFDPADGPVEDAVRDYTKGEMAELVIVGPGTVEAMQLGLRCAAKGGTVLLFTTSTPEAQAAARSLTSCILTKSVSSPAIRAGRMTPVKPCG